ncbi:HEXXH motif domain-containing protein [Nocardia acidivorans]|uniref:HEXXH motif domain-containing protein n=1 Tax=Nocardia acidivorans TaxID=404580 RepID=UPI0012FBE058|nr:HEXXH motif domain-containing protein [Nocardia acidivorans]
MITVPVHERADITADLSSGHGTAASIAALTDGLITMRVILLRQLLTTVDDETAELSGLPAAYESLAALQSEHPDIVASMLAYPNTGAWLSRVLRRAAGSSDDSVIPLWADCAYLGWLAVAAQIACHAEGTARLVIRNGAVVLPNLGLAKLGETGHHGRCDIAWSACGALRFSWPGGSLRIASRTDESHPDWLPMRWLRASPGEPRIWLDDLDPFRVLQSGTDGLRLTTTEAERWQCDFTAAWQLLRADFDEYLTPMRACLTSVTPLSARPQAAGTSHTAWNGLGCVYTTAPADSCQLALTMIHEIQHTKFGLLTDQIELFTPDSACRFYAPWRADPRPISGLLHGIYAFHGVTDFWRVHRHSECHGSTQTHAEFELGRIQLAAAVEQAMTSGLLTAAGDRFLRALADAMSPWRHESVPLAARQVAAETITAHRTFWRIRNLEPDPAAIAELAARWWARRPPGPDLPTAAFIAPERVPERYRGLPLAAQLKAVDPGAAAALATPGQPEGDRAYLAGYPTEALALYARELRADPLRPQAWAGLILAGQRVFGGKLFETLSERGEVVAGLYAEIGPEAEILDLLRWLSPVGD